MTQDQHWDVPPHHFVMSAILGMPFLSVLIGWGLFHQATHPTSIPLVSGMGLLAVEIQTLSLCFFWKRVRLRSLKQVLAGMLTASVWGLLGVGSTAMWIPRTWVTELVLFMMIPLWLSVSFMATLLFALYITDRQDRHQSLGRAMLFMGGMLLLIAGFTSWPELPSSNMSHVLMPHPSSPAPSASPVDMGFPPVDPHVHGEEAQDSSQADQDLAHQSHQEDPDHWDYETLGPSIWGQLNPQWQACTQGQRQSPLDIDKDAKQLHQAFQPFYQSTTWQPQHRYPHILGWTSQQGGYMLTAGRKYALKSFFWHTPSEHAIGGVFYPLELQLIHEDDNGGLAIVSVLFERVAAFQADLHSLSQALLSPEDPWTGDISSWLPAQKSHYRYLGSQTTPPCQEGVLWSVLATPKPIGAQQLLSLTQRLSPNQRPLQATHARQISAPLRPDLTPVLAEQNRDIDPET